MPSIEQIEKKNLPTHIAITMDGNGRWAQRKGKFRVFGHQNGIRAVRETVETAAKIGIRNLTLYAFSTENWKRSKKEVNALMTLLVSTINEETKTLMKNDISLQAIGDIDKLPKKCKRQLNEAIEKTKENSKMRLILALSYSGRWEIINAVNNILKMNKEKAIDKITEETFQQYLNTKNVPDPELLIRTSGEKRISNFLLWQIAYSELYFTETLWPDFRKEHLIDAIIDFQKRERRFGTSTEN
tara:strand:- start:20525 stop:21253 length:729 start_codon:yes stop_codon:yes gene_type:complete